MKQRSGKNISIYLSNVCFTNAEGGRREFLPRLLHPLSVYSRDKLIQESTNDPFISSTEASHNSSSRIN